MKNSECVFHPNNLGFVLNETAGDIVIKLIRNINDEIQFTIKNAEFETLNDKLEADQLKEIELAFISQADATTKECIQVKVTSDSATYY